MPVIRVVREGRDVECYPGENLREVALRAGIQLYGLKGTLGNCGGCGQCITCFVEVPDEPSAVALSPRTTVEEQKLGRRSQNWRLACQALVNQSLRVITRPQGGLADKEALLAASMATPVPLVRTAMPQAEVGADVEAEAAAEPGAGREGDSATSGDVS